MVANSILSCYLFSTHRIFSLEYIRKRLNADEFNFMPKKHKVAFKLKKEVGPFIVNTQETLQIATNLLSTMGFQQG